MIMEVQARYVREGDTIVGSLVYDRKVSQVHVEYDGLVRLDLATGGKLLYDHRDVLTVIRGEK